MVPASRRRVLRQGTLVGGLALTGCIGFAGGGEYECETGRTRHTDDATLPRGADWPMYRYDPGNTGFVPDATVPDGIELKWRYTACAEVESGATVGGGRVYAGRGVFDAADGTRISGEWHSHQRTPAVVGGTRFVGTHELLALDENDGTEQWAFDPRGEAGAVSAPIVAGGRVYVAGNLDDPTLYAVDATGGTERWRFQPGSAVDESPAVVDGRVYLVDDGGGVHALDAATGDVIWQRTEPDHWTGPPAVANGTVYVGSHDSGVIALSTADGSERWRYEGVEGVTRPVAVAEEDVVAGTPEGRVLVLAATDGRERWTRERGVGVSAPVVAEETILIGERHGTRLYALSRDDGSERWRFETRSVTFGDYIRGGIPFGPTTVGDVVYVPTAASDLYALGAPTGRGSTRNTTGTVQ